MSAFVALRTLACAVALLLSTPVMFKTQEAPNLPPSNSQIPRLPSPPLLDAYKMKCPPGTHGEVHPQINGCVPDCPDGWRAKSPKDPDACIKGEDSCAIVSPVWRRSHDPNTSGWEARLCDARSVVISRIDPVYPPDAVAAKEQGTVEFIVIGYEDGRIVVPVPPLRWAPLRLQNAAKATLDQWRWKPFLLNEKPISFRTAVYFKFELLPEGPRVHTFLTKPKE